MKHMVAFFLALVLCIGLTACATENKYAELEQMLDEGRYSEAMTYILSLQAQNTGSVPFWGIAIPDSTVTDQDKDDTQGSDAETEALLDLLMDEWVARYDNSAVQRFVFREDGTCTVDDKEMTWTRYTPAPQTDSYTVIGLEEALLSVWDGETECYRICAPVKSDSGEFHFSIRTVNKDGSTTLGGADHYFCPGHYETVELTMDNWQEYLELVEKPSHSTNAFGEVTGMSVYHRLVLKEEYANRRSEYATSSGAVEFLYTRQKRHAQINSDGKTYSVGEAAGEGYSYTEVKNLGTHHAIDLTYFGAPIADSYLENDIRFLPGDQRWCQHIRDISLLRIQGTLYLVKEQ